MEKVISTEQIPIKIWADEMEEGALVMDNQKDLVKVLVELTPLAVIKG